jgi:hypothetical protein
MAKKADADPRVDKRKVTLRNFGVAGVDENGKPVLTEFKVEDYVRDTDVEGANPLQAYVAAARAAGWQQVDVSEDFDAGPGGYDGATHYPADLDHPLAGQTHEATGA